MHRIRDSRLKMRHGIRMLAAPRRNRMASITREIHVAAAPGTVWDRVRDIPNTHRLFAGVLTGCAMEEGARVVTFANGMVVRELIVDVDDTARRVAYAAVGGRTTH